MEDPTLGGDDKAGVGTALEAIGVQMLRSRVMRMDLAITMIIGMEARRELPDESIYISPSLVGFLVSATQNAFHIAAHSTDSGCGFAWILCLRFADNT